MKLKTAPDSLFGRLMLAIVAVIGLTLLVIVALIARERRDLALLGTGAWSTVQVISEASEALAQLSGPERDAELFRFRRESISTDADFRPRPPPRRVDMAATASAYASRIRRALGEGYGVSVSPARARGNDVIRVGFGQRMPRVPERRPGRPDADNGGRGERVAGFMRGRLLDVDVTLPDGEQVVFRTVAPEPGPPLPSRIFIEIGLLTTIIAVVLYFMTRTITRPLSDLSQAAESVGRGVASAPLAERGAREIREATRAFNTMQDRLRRYLDSRTRVLAAMSHDLRTPLTRLRLRAESIADPELKARFTADLDEMNAMVKGALGVFRDLNEVEALVPVDIEALLAELKAGFAETGGDITVSGHLDAPLPARPGALKRCLANLLQNALQYGSKAHIGLEDGAEVVIRIRDEGPGIPEELLEQVFEPFFRVEASRNRDTGGTGLGLSIARDVIQAHGGDIRLHNVVDGGLEAVIRLPRAVGGRA